jgi:hypothetical protein
MLKMTSMSWVFCALVFFDVSGYASAITLATSDNVNLLVPPVTGSLNSYSGSACVGIPAMPPNCVGGGPPSTLQPSNSVTAPSGSAQASSTGPTNLSQPLVLTADGQINASSSAGESSGYSFSVIPSTAVTNYYLFPNISLDFAPDGLSGSASVSASQETEAQGIDYFEELLLQIDLNGSSSGGFTLDSNTNIMSLTAPPGDSGFISLYAQGTSAGGVQSTTLIDFEFQNGVVTVANNTLGLALPTVGTSADFLLNSVTPFQASLPAISPGDSLVVLTFDGIDQSATLATPEQGTVTLTMAGLGLGLCRVMLPFLRRRSRAAHQTA